MHGMYVRIRTEAGADSVLACNGLQPPRTDCILVHMLEEEEILLIEYCRVEKYRPATLDDVVSHKDITSTSKRIVMFDTVY